MAVPDGWPSARVRAGAQNPAYRPARPPPELERRIGGRFGGPPCSVLSGSGRAALTRYRRPGACLVTCPPSGPTTA
jgi:hypothetical protein